MTNADDVLRVVESLALILQDSAEVGNLETEIYADMAELIRYLATKARNMIGGAA